MDEYELYSKNKDLLESMTVKSLTEMHNFIVKVAKSALSNVDFLTIIEQWPSSLGDLLTEDQTLKVQDFVLDVIHSDAFLGNFEED